MCPAGKVMIKDAEFLPVEVTATDTTPAPLLPDNRETVQNFVPWRILLRHGEAFFEHDGELAFDSVPFAH